MLARPGYGSDVNRKCCPGCTNPHRADSYRDEAEGLHYFVMPYIDGASLNHVVEEARNCETSQANGATTSLPAIAAAWLKKEQQS